MTNIAASFSASSSSLTSRSTSPGLLAPIAAPLSRVRLDIMNRAAGTPFVRDVGDCETYAPAVEAQHVEEVASDVARGLHVGGYFVVFVLGEFGGKNRLLYLARNVELILQGDQLVARRERLAPLRQVVQRTVYGDLEVLEVDGLGDEVEGAPVHRGTDILHIPVGRNDHGAYVRIDLGYLFEQGQPVHPGHVDVREHDVDAPVRVEPLEGLHAVVGEDELILASSDLAPHALQHQRLEVRLVVNYKYFECALHRSMEAASRPTGTLWRRLARSVRRPRATD